MKKLLQYVIAIVVGIILSLIIIIPEANDIFTKDLCEIEGHIFVGDNLTTPSKCSVCGIKQMEDAIETNDFGKLSNAFLLPGVLLTGVGLLIVASNKGTFDMLVYGLKSFFGFFRTGKSGIQQSFYDYKQEKAKHKMSFWFLLIVGVHFLALAIVFSLISANL